MLKNNYFKICSIFILFFAHIYIFAAETKRKAEKTGPYFKKPILIINAPKCVTPEPESWQKVNWPVRFHKTTSQIIQDNGTVQKLHKAGSISHFQDIRSWSDQKKVNEYQVTLDESDKAQRYAATIPKSASIVHLNLSLSPRKEADIKAWKESTQKISDCRSIIALLNTFQTKKTADAHYLDMQQNRSYPISTSHDSNIHKHKPILHLTFKLKGLTGNQRRLAQAIDDQWLVGAVNMAELPVIIERTTVQSPTSPFNNETTSPTQKSPTNEQTSPSSNGQGSSQMVKPLDKQTKKNSHEFADFNIIATLQHLFKLHHAVIAPYETQLNNYVAQLGKKYNKNGKNELRVSDFTNQEFDTWNHYKQCLIAAKKQAPLHVHITQEDE